MVSTRKNIAKHSISTNKATQGESLQPKPKESGEGGDISQEVCQRSVDTADVGDVSSEDCSITEDSGLRIAATESIHSKSQTNRPTDKGSLPKTLDDLEREILGASDSDEDYSEFSFLKLTDEEKSRKLENVGSKDKSEGALASLFVIDRASDSVEVPASIAEQPVTGEAQGLEKAAKKTKPRAAPSRDDLIKSLATAPTELQVATEESYLDIGAATRQMGAAARRVHKEKTKPAESEIMQKSVLNAGFEKKHSIPAYSEGKKALARKHREEKAKTKKDWFDMKAPEMTDELEADVEAIQMRGSAASWTGYKKNDYKKGPKFFQIATVEDSPVDFYHSRVLKKDRKRTIVDELLADANFRKTNKKQYIKASEKLIRRHPNKKRKA